MADIAGMLAIVMSLGMAPAIIKIRSDAKFKARKLELEAGEGGGKATKRLLDENKLLRDRIENLETIVSSVDYELNQKVMKLLDEQRSRVLPAGPAPVAASPAAGGGAGVAATTPATPALDATMTAAPTREGKMSVGTTLEPGQVLAGRYRVQRLLGKGGMGAVYLADDEVLHELVALKVISSAYASDEAAMIARFRREASAARKVSSPQVIRIHDLGEARPGLLYLSMEYFSGRTLAELIAQRGVVPMKDIEDILQQIGAGLEAAHQAGVIHRDLKPSNVLIGERGAVKLIDFGLATTLVGDQLTATGAILGTPHYMAPEQVRGKPVDARSDIYAFGALAYHLVTGRPPFAGDNAIAIGFAHISETPEAPHVLRKDCPPKLDAAIMAALAKNPADRPASAKAFLALAFSAIAA
ncbi:MAG: serine/threonine-protein kinase [Deltaproteobacteria bacterium]